MLTQLGRQITRINIASFHKTPVLYRINSQASGAKQFQNYRLHRIIRPPLVNQNLSKILGSNKKTQKPAPKVEV